MWNAGLWQSLEPWVPSRRLPVRELVSSVLLGILVVHASRLPAQKGRINREYEIKVAYLYHFGKYVRWPPKAEFAWTQPDEFIIAVADKEPFADFLRERAKTDTIQGRLIRVVVATDPEKLPRAHLFFVPAVAGRRFNKAVLQAAAEQPVLVVGETKGFAEAGGMLNFYMEEDRVKFEVNSEAASRVGLQISAKLLQLGKRVETAAEDTPPDSDARQQLEECR